MLKQMLNAFAMLLVFTVITGLAYPLAMTGVAQALFPFQANGSIIVHDGKPIGSALIGQNFTSAKYFHGRPSAAGTDGYDATSSGGSNLGPTSKKLVDTVTDNIIKARDENQLDEQKLIPADLVLASGSGLDPDISPAAAYLQVARVSKERELSGDEIRRLVDSHVKVPQLGIFGEPRVNVLELNLALDRLKK
ncbi:potassium-transporting ATPase subunit KdpC [Pelosinus sp. IPA-1]|uniref:potassium-transporting ATPase subunit KdpC n=1 Tax=Pelosinus sp. IPA-1 TaxID=3029569 RepID=UPI0024362082|nr:potassium-transporting ATPase subunit KdpC [Pelosinus sp. IPA-1]GMA97289.1 potassium-transporting ATPase KdpC subunit [Pelosinus sp. IPA-1]